MSQEQRVEILLWSSTVDNGKWKTEVVQSSDTEATLYITKMPSSVEYMETFDFKLDHEKGIPEEALEEWQDKAIMWIDKQDEYGDSGIVIPEDARMFGEGLVKLFGRIPEGPYRSINFDKGWYGLIIDLDTELSNIRPDYIVKQIKEENGKLIFKFDLPTTPFTCCEDFHMNQVPPENDEGDEYMAWWKETNEKLTEHLKTEEHLKTVEKSLEEKEELKPTIEEMTEIVKSYQESALTLCEACGAPGELETFFWHKTLCPKHLAELEKLTPEDIQQAAAINEVIENATLEPFVEVMPKEEPLGEGKFIERF
jgi:hypothetical protein